MSTSLTIRLVAEADCITCLGSNHLDKKNTCRDTTTLACGISRKMKDETIFVAISGQQLAGFIEVHPPTSLAAHQAMATKYWRFARFQGIGGSLLSYVKDIR